MTLTTMFDTYEVGLEIREYAVNDRPAIEILSKDADGYYEPFASLTVNLPQYELEENEAFVDINNFREALDFIKTYNLGTLTDKVKQSGFVFYPIVEFDMDEINKYIL